ncbi:FimB/Mfa2 family fimbrial subunit, partial [uncultured Parabacteroides sp.]
MKSISVNIIFVLTLLCVQSCIKEDIVPCKDNTLLLKFGYTLNNRYTNLFGSDVSEIAVYIFDDKGRYLEMSSEVGEILTNDYIMSVPLPEGSYQVVAYGYGSGLNTFSIGTLDRLTNKFDSKLETGMTDIQDLRIMLENRETQEGYLEPVAVPRDLFFGYVAHAVSSSDANSLTYIDLIKNTKNVTVKITGLNALANTSAIPDIYITSVNGRYKFDNTIDMAHRMLKYVPTHISTGDNQLEANFKMMRLVLDHTSILTIEEP